MTELATEIRKAVIERVDRAPMAPTIEAIDTLDRASLPVAHRPPRRGVLVGAGMVALLALVAGVLVAARMGDDSSKVSVGTTQAPSGGPATPLAGRSLPARYGLVGAVPGYAMTMELDRPVGLAAGDVTWFPTGPLGPVYAQGFRQTSDPTTSPTMMDGFAVLTVLPEEEASVIAAATGNGATHPTTIGPHEATAVTPWSGTDQRALTWVQDGVAIIVTASSTVTDQQLEAAAEKVTTIPTIPLLTPVVPNPGGGGAIDGFYSLDPHAQPPAGSRPDDTVGNPWAALLYNPALGPAMGTLLESTTVDGTPFSITEIGDPASHRISLGTVAFDSDTGAVIWDTDHVTLFAGSGDQPVPDHFLVSGSTPADTASIRIRLDDGTVIDAPTYGVGRGWPIRPYAVAVPNGREIVHVESRSSDGTVRYSGAPVWADGARPSADRAGGIFYIGRCGSSGLDYVQVDC